MGLIAGQPELISAPIGVLEKPLSKMGLVVFTIWKF